MKSARHRPALFTPSREHELGRVASSDVAA
jgi:hypothetical protein